MSYYGNNNPLSAMGDLRTVESTPIITASAHNGILNNILPASAAGGVVDSIDSKFRATSGIDPDGLAVILTNQQMYVKAGQGGEIIFDAMFDTPVLLCQQLAGFINSEDSFSIGFVGLDFGVVHYYNGKDEALEIKVNTSGSGTATITIDGIAYTVTLTSGTVKHNAYEIANQLSGIVPNYTITATGDLVKILAFLPGARGTFSFVGSTASVDFIKLIEGSLPIVNFTRMQDFNGLQIFDGFNPNLLNHFKIVFDGNIHFYIQNPDTSSFDLIHTIKYLNTSTNPHSSNPTFRGGWLVRNLGSTISKTIEGSKMGLFLQGKDIKQTFIQGASSSQDIDLVENSILTIRNRFEFNNKINRSSIILKSLSIITESTRAMFYNVYLNPVFASEIIYEYVNKNYSIAEVSKDKSAIISFDSKLAEYSTKEGSGLPIHLDSLVLNTDDIICITAINTRNQLDSATTSLSWVEDL